MKEIHDATLTALRKAGDELTLIIDMFTFARMIEKNVIICRTIQEVNVFLFDIGKVILIGYV